MIVSDKVVLHKDCLELSKRKLVEYLEAHGSIEARMFTDLLGTTRKYSIRYLLSSMMPSIISKNLMFPPTDMKMFI